MDKKLRTFAGIIFCSIGGTLVYGSAIDMISVGADSVSGVSTSRLSVTIIFAVGVLLLASGIMSALFIFSSMPERKK